MFAILQTWGQVQEEALRQLVVIIRINGTPLGYVILFLLLSIIAWLYMKVRPIMGELKEVIYFVKDIRQATSDLSARRRENVPELSGTSRDGHERESASDTESERLTTSDELYFQSDESSAGESGKRPLKD